MKVNYYLNGKRFTDYNINVSASKGFGTLKRKAVKSYDWAEYHGTSVDLESPKFEPRTLDLDCWIKGDSWQDMINQFNLAIRDELAKSGTQRLLIEPFGFKPMPFEIYSIDEINVDKRFSDGKMFGDFKLKLIEPNPIKKVLRVIGNAVTLSYESGLETEIFWGNGSKSIVAGNAAVNNKPLSEGAIIIIAGNIEQITNFQTNAEVLWERL